MNVYLSGMIGSGKTTIGRPLADRLGTEFFDLDDTMDARLGYSFHTLVKEEGWLAFRQLEYTICKDFAKRCNSIICLGGGTVRYDWNVDVLKKSGIIVFLEVSPEELVRRVRLADRPRVNPGTTLEEDVDLMWKNSRNKYFDSADIVFKAEGKSVEEEIKELEHMIRTDKRFESFFVREKGRGAEDEQA